MAASEVVCDYVRHNSRPFIFSASIPPSACAVALASLRYLRAHPERVERLHALSTYARNAYKAAGLQIRESETPIIPIYTWELENTVVKNKQVYDAGVYVNPVLPPATPPTDCLLRTSYMATHTEALLDEAMDIIAANIEG
jgi:7-keto-8-aminopelargonate synthetase-like enzyme